MCATQYCPLCPENWPKTPAGYRSYVTTNTNRVFLSTEGFFEHLDSLETE